MPPAPVLPTAPEEPHHLPTLSSAGPHVSATGLVMEDAIALQYHIYGTMYQMFDARATFAHFRATVSDTHQVRFYLVC